MTGEKFPKIPSTETCNGRNIRRGKYCRNRAGAGTDHLGEGRCKWHGGTNSRLTHGERSVLARYADHNVLGERIRRARASGDLLKLEDEVAILSAIVEDFVARRTDRTFEAGELDRVVSLLTTLIDAKKKAHDVGRAWTDARAENLMRYIGEVIGRVLVGQFGEDPRIPAVLRELKDEFERFRV